MKPKKNEYENQSHFLIHILISRITETMNKMARTIPKPTFHPLPAFPKWIPQNIFIAAKNIKTLPTVKWYQFQYFLALESLFGRAKNAITYKILEKQIISFSSRYIKEHERLFSDSLSIKELLYLKLSIHLLRK